MCIYIYDTNIYIYIYIYIYMYLAGAKEGISGLVPWCFHSSTRDDSEIKIMHWLAHLPLYSSAKLGPLA